MPKKGFYAQNTGSMGAGAAGRKADHSSPLRKIIETVDRPIYGTLEPEKVVGWRTVEVLECGHEQSIKEDFGGRYYAERRRCKKCAKEVQG